MTETPDHSLPDEKPLESAADARALRDASGVASARLESDTGKSSYAGYLFGSSGTEARPAWSDSMRGRLGIRILSRGIVGAGFFTMGGHFARQQLEGYESFEPLAFTFKHMREKPLQYVARGFDRVVGVPLEHIVHFFTPGSAAAKANAAWEVTTFRNKLWPLSKGAEPTQVDRWGVKHYLNGRGLGEEVVAITFDFSAASVGDALTRNLIQALDPNVKQPWVVDDHGHATTYGKGHFDAGRWTQSLGRSSWRILSKNAGEDWAAAIPYIFQMKWQRQALAKFFPGFKLSSDHGWNGGVVRAITRMGPDGKEMAETTNGYQIPGVLDLQARFVGYNWYTLMYREMYDALGRTVNRWRDDGFRLHTPKFDHPVESLIGTPGFFARYIVKSFIKANLYMNPAVIPFWLTRVPQTKWRGAIADDHLATTSQPSRENALFTLGMHGPATAGTDKDPIRTEPVNDIYPRAQLIHAPQRPKTAFVGTREVDMSNLLKHPDPYTLKGVRRNFAEAFLNPFGAFCFHTGSGLTKLVDRIAPNGDAVSRWMHQGLTGKDLLLAREKTLRTFVDASISYTPYMWAKAETALAVDDRRSVEQLGHMDKAIYRLIDNGFTFKFHETKQAWDDVWHLAINYEGGRKIREGAVTQGVGDGSVVPRATDRAEPHSKIQTGSIMRVPMQEKSATPAGDAGQQKPWADAVGARKDAAVNAPSSSALH